MRLYVNGTQVATLAATGNIATSTNPLSIGGDGIYGQYFAGLIDNVRVYNTALTAAQIQTDMTTPVAPMPPIRRRRRRRGRSRATAVSAQPSRSELGRGHRQRRGHRLPHRALPGRRLHQLHPDRHHRTATTYSDTTAAAGTSYSYRVRANDAAGNLGPYSNPATATTPSPDTTPPGKPGTLTATAVSATEVDLSWGAATDNVGVTGYHIERCQGAGCTSFTEIGTTTAPPPPTTTPPPPPAPATATASAPTTPPATSAPTPTPPARQRVQIRRRARMISTGRTVGWARIGPASVTGDCRSLHRRWSDRVPASLVTSGRAETYASDQYSQVEVTSTQLTGGQWIGPAVRVQNGGQDTYLGIYFWNNGSPQLRLYERSAGTWTQLGGSYNSGCSCSRRRSPSPWWSRSTAVFREPAPADDRLHPPTGRPAAPRARGAARALAI